MGCGFQEERVPFLRAMGQLESLSPEVVGSRDEVEESEVGYSPCSWKTGLFVGILCWRESISGDNGSGGLWSRLGMTGTLEILYSTTGIGRTCCMTWTSWTNGEK